MISQISPTRTHSRRVRRPIRPVRTQEKGEIPALGAGRWHGSAVMRGVRVRLPSRSAPDLTHGKAPAHGPPRSAAPLGFFETPGVDPDLGRRGPEAGRQSNPPQSEVAIAPPGLERRP